LAKQARSGLVVATEVVESAVPLLALISGDLAKGRATPEANVI
jgi:hypothetical protein